MIKSAIRSPIIYAGSKGRYANVITPLLPPTLEVKNALDVFCGSGEVGVGMFEYDKVSCNDLTTQVIEMHEFFQECSIDFPEVVEFLQQTEKSYGLGKFHKDNLKDLQKGYTKLKEEYNKSLNPVLLYLLHCNSFSNGIRFVNKTFNMPYGRRNFNPSLQNKLAQWLKVLQSKNVEFTNKDFRELQFNAYDFVYLDPMYLLTSTGYSESSKTGWGVKEEYALYKKIDQYKGKFMLSNQLYSKGQCNHVLKEWIESRDDLVVVELDNSSYKNCNYQRKEGKTTEILVMNYRNVVDTEVVLGDNQYRENQADLSQVADWELHGFQSAYEYGQWLDFNSKEDDSYENFRDNTL